MTLIERIAAAVEDPIYISADPAWGDTERVVIGLDPDDLACLLSLAGIHR